ncbi:U-box domain-containing protein 15-like [Trifolium pratense]|uniref:U-box domain-containing protein 15-like n=1 Tax=Trifolium pratense TaxID=57577 RepID=UPI001E6962C1|nr:U-box domain-containing protein 15-like [Trifolium pratense]
MEETEEREGNAEQEEEEEECDAVAVVGEIQHVIESVVQVGEYRRTQRKESHVLARRFKHILPLMEDLRDLQNPVPQNGVVWLRNLRDALLLAKELLKLCSQGSKIHLALEGEAVMIKFQKVYEKLSQAFDGVPCDELGISDEVKEQLELMHVQLRRARRRTDTQDIELAMDMMVVFSDDHDRNADSAIVERLAIKLELRSFEDLEVETVAVGNLVRERKGQQAESTQKIIGLLNRFKRVAGMEETAIVLDGDPAMPNKMLGRSTSLVIPHEFLCPITLEIMTDPVIVASGQTYERESIEKWFKSNHKTCPKTRQPLEHLQLAPNCALKNLIVEWCENNNFKLPKIYTSSCQEGSSSTENQEEIPSLVESLGSINLEHQRKAVERIRMLSKENPENRVLVAEHGGIPPLVQLLSYPDSKIKEHAVTALLNLSIDEDNKKLISQEGAIPAIIEVLENGSIVAKENSAAALFSLSMIDENKEIVGISNGIQPLVNLLQNGTVRGKKDAATALFSLSLNNANKDRAIRAGIVTPLLELLQDTNLGMIDEALSILLLLVLNPEGRQEIGHLSFIEILVGFIREGTPKNKECAASVLLELCSSNSSFTLAALQFGVYDHLIQMKQTGTNRAQRKANAILDLISKSEQI